MIKYIFYTPNKQKKKIEYDLTFVSKHIQGEIIGTYVGKNNLKRAVGYAILTEAVLVTPLLQHLGDTPTQIISLCKTLGSENIVCCELPYLNDAIITALCYAKCQRNLYSSICSSIGKQGKGTPENFNNEGRRKGGEAMRQKALKHYANMQALAEIERLTSMGDLHSLQFIADRLNELQLRTTRNKLWSAGGIRRLQNQVRRSSQ